MLVGNAMVVFLTWVKNNIMNCCNYIVCEAGEWNVIGRQQNVALLQHAGGPRHLVREEAFDSNQSGKGGARVDAAGHG